MFLKETTVRSGGRRYVYVQLVEGYRDERGRVRQRVVANLGRKEKLKASGELDRLAAAFTRLDPPPEGTRRRCGALALVAHYLARLGLVEAVERACPLHGRAQLTHGEVIGALVANRLTDPRPLYDVRGWAEEQGAHPLLGTPAALLNDDRLGRALDALAARVEEVKGALCLRALERFGCEPARVHWDFTSVSVEGSHAGSELIRFGHSSDKRSHLRQAKLGQAVSEQGVALYHRSEAGARNETGALCDALERLKAALGRQHFLLCADTALVSQANLRALIADGISFLAPLPQSFGYRERYLAELAPKLLSPLDYVSARQRRLPASKRTRYRGAELDWPLELESGDQVCLRALYVHSSEEQAACRRSRARALERTEQKLARVERGLGSRHYPDHEAVARKLAQLLQGTPGRFLRAEAGEQAGKPTLRYWRDEDAIAHAERLDGIYCLISNVTKDEADAAKLLAWFKEQEQVERSHRTLKGPLRVRPLFVQNDERIVALIAVCCFALMIYTLIERDARHHYPDGLPALGEGRRGPATSRAVFSLLEDTTLVYSPEAVTIEPAEPARELFERLTA
ncbi:MAG: IS1634 family transposase [Actinobacteria bacterium]|nr:IS1634 family transposase [Actinomycetota bacterium]MCA1700358.1 IS1634 family transposase [Actinomycetota bacterium]